MHFISCSNDSYQEIDKVTGLAIYDVNGGAIGLWNVPNDNSEVGVVFPNPSSGLVSLFSSEPLSRVWIVSADCSPSSDEDIRALSDDLIYTVSEVDNLAIRSFDLNGDFGNLNLQDLAAGFYRVFYESITGELFWQNIFIDPSVISFPDFSILDEAC